MQKKSFAILAAVMMVAVAGISVLNVDDSEADTNVSNVYGDFGIFINYGANAESWTSGSSTGHDAAIALFNYCTTNSINKEIDMATFNESWGYKNINTDYGNVTKIGNIGETEQSTDKWHSFYYHEGTGAGWKDCTTDALGFYKPFGDYNNDFQTANIALYFGDSAGAAAAKLKIPAPTETVMEKSQIDNNNDFLVSFYFKINNVNNLLDRVEAVNGSYLDINGLPGVDEAALMNGVTLTGHGSDLYIALKDAIGANVTGIDAVPGFNNGTYLSNYSWIETLFGLETALTNNLNDDDWTNDLYGWWIQYTTYDPTTNVGVKSDFVLGYYSPVPGSPNQLTSYNLVFDETTAE